MFSTEKAVDRSKSLTEHQAPDSAVLSGKTTSDQKRARQTDRQADRQYVWSLKALFFCKPIQQ